MVDNKANQCEEKTCVIENKASVAEGLCGKGMYRNLILFILRRTEYWHLAEALHNSRSEN